MTILTGPSVSGKSSDMVWKNGAGGGGSLPAPYSDAVLHVEQAALGLVMVRNEAYWECVSEGLRPEHFLSTLHARLWQVIGELIAAGQLANPLTLTPRFAGDHDFEALGGHRYLGQLAVMAIRAGSGRSCARDVREWDARRGLIDLGGYLNVSASDGQQALEAIASEVEARLDACRPAGEASAWDFAVALDQVQRANLLAAERGGLDGVPFGLQELDAFTGGMGRSDLTIAAGRPSMGKSAFGLHVALHNARQGRCVVLFTLEMSAAQLCNRAIAQGCGISADKLRSGSYDHSFRPAIDQAADALKPLPIFIDDSSALQSAEIKAKARRIAAKRPIDLIVIDHVQLMRPPQRSENRVQELTGITNGLKGVAKSLSVPVLALSQLNRAPEQREDKRPLLADLRESGSLEQDADQVVLLYREHYYAQREEPRETDTEAHRAWVQRMMRCAGKADLIVAKNRHGGVGIAKVGFDPVFTRFHDLPR